MAVGPGSTAVAGGSGSGSGRYRGTLSATVSGPHGTVAALTGASATAVALTTAGGTFRVNVTGSDDHTLDTTVSWACP